MYIVPGPEEDAESGQTMRGIVGGTKLFNRFTLQKVLGRGGMGIVWLARDERLDRLIALKLVPESVSFDASAREDLKRETRKSLLLTHPNIVRIFDFIEEEHSAAISMEYVDGATLSSLRVKKPAKYFEVDEIAPWVISLCDALTYAHDSAGLVHRDLKPANLMVNSRGELKITDFGIACTMRDSMSYVSLPTSSGTLNYMSPQQLLGEDPSPADDIYAVGATLYEMLSSKPPFYGGDIASQVREVLPPTIAQRRARFGISAEPIPKYWEETIARCLAKNPEHRPRTPADIARRLRLGGPVRLSEPEPAPNIQLVKVLADLRDKLRAIDPRMAGFAGGMLALIAAVIISFHHPKASAPHIVNAMEAVSAPHPADVGSVRAPNTKSDTTYPRAVGYAMEKPEVAAATAAIPKALSETGTLRPISVTEEPASSSASSGTLQLTTTPPGARFAIYPGVVAGKSAPAAAPLRTGSAPDSIQDLPPGRYTLFFHNDGWPEDRVEISISAGESVPVDYTFPHGRATITSIPERAEIFLGTRSLGYAPLDIDLPLGKQKLSARLSGFSERTQTITIENGKEAKIEFQMRVRRSAKPTPTPSALDKIGQTFKNIFGHKPPPTREKRSKPAE